MLQMSGQKGTECLIFLLLYSQNYEIILKQIEQNKLNKCSYLSVFVKRPVKDLKGRPLIISILHAHISKRKETSK